MAPNADIMVNMYGDCYIPRIGPVSHGPGDGRAGDGYIGNLGRQDSEYDDTLAQSAEMIPPRQRDVSMLTVALCIILPGGLFVLAGLALRRYLKG